MFFQKKIPAVSRYNLVTPCPDGGHLLYNQMSGALVVLDDARRADYDAVASGHPRGVPRDFLKTLADGWFTTAENEREVIRKAWQTNTTSPLNKTMTVVTTDKCNLGCVYCYEDKADWKNMTVETQELVKKFVTRYLESSPTSAFSVIWFGGEATLNMQAIENLSVHFIAECERLGIPYKPSIVTNGTTLTDHVIDRLEACQIRELQITVDGIKEDHDAKRPYLREMTADQMNPAQVAQRRKIEPTFGLSLNVIGQEPKVRPVRSSFEDIMRNIRNLHTRGFKVNLRVNVDNANKDGVKTFFQQVEAEGLMQLSPKNGHVSVYSHPIFDGCGGCSSTKMSKAEHATFETTELSRYSRDEGSKKTMHFTGQTCTANMDFQFVINQNGGITKCWHHATDLSQAVAHVRDLEIAERGTAAVDRYKFNPLDDEECSSCHVLPLCMGGCKSNNQFPEKGYGGSHEMGCHATRYSLAEKVVDLYQKRKS